MATRGLAEMEIPEVHKLCLEEIRSNMAFLTGGYTMKDSGDTLAELSRLFQGLGICHLLETLDVGEFRENLVRSSDARRYFLRKCREEGSVASKHLALSRTEALLDALAAGDLRLARSIAELSPINWNRDWEYEDDFCFYAFLNQLLLQAPPPDREQTLARFEAALEGGSSTRLNVLRAILAKDAGDVETALAQLVEEEQARFDAQRSAIVDSKFLFWPRSFVSIEGLALLRAAELVGLQVSGDFAMCPPEARLPVRENDYRDFFLELDVLLGAA
jgi:hypothetical protein